MFQNQFNSIFAKIASSIFIFIVVLLCFVSTTFAANLSVVPVSTSVTVGNITSVRVLIATSGKSINNIDGTLLFPADLLEVLSISKSSSIFSLWVEEPKFSNFEGKVTFNGGVPNPGFVGESGEVVSVTFKAKKPGVASVVFSNSAVRENDGLGTDVLKGTFGSSITIVDTKSVVPDVKNYPSDVRLALKSSTHPSSDKWYSKKDVSVSWTLPLGATSVRTLFDSRQDSTPVTPYGISLTTREIKNVSDGIWYFHAVYLTGSGWSPVSHFRVQVDTTPPESISVESKQDESGKYSLALKSKDILSGIDYFSIRVNGNEPIIVKEDKSSEQTLYSYLPLSSGVNNIIVEAYDMAGNKIEKTLTITRDFLFDLSIDSYPSKVRVGGTIDIKGTSPYPNSDLLVTLQKGEIIDSFKIKSNQDSKFEFSSAKIKDSGEYVLGVEVLNSDGVKILSSKKITIQAVKPLLIQIGSYTTELLTVLVPALALLVLFVLILYYGWYKFLLLRGRVQKEVNEAESALHTAFHLLRENAYEQIKMLEDAKTRRPLTGEEEKIIKNLQDNLIKIEKPLEKEILDIKDVAK